MQISFCLQINHDFSWSVVLYQQQIEYSTSTVLNRFSLNLNSAAELCQVIQALESRIICQGNPDEKFTLLYSYKKGIFKDQSVMYYIVVTALHGCCNYYVGCTQISILFCIISYTHIHVYNVSCYIIGSAVVAKVENHIQSHPTIRHSKCDLQQVTI